MLDRFLTGLIVNDRLRVTYPSGVLRAYGPQPGPDQDPGLHFEVTNDATLRRLVLNPELAFGESYMDGTVRVDPADLLRLMKLFVRNRQVGRMPAWVHTANRARFHIRRFIQKNAPTAARRNVAHHYDISDDLYRLFLDADMQYSCAYFRNPDMSLEAAQSAKKAHIAAKLLLEPGMKVLDIGCGWGGMALTLARDHNVRVTGITLSQNQLDTARARAKAMGLRDRVRFELMDYRHMTRRFDRVVSVGMFEHVGMPNYDTYFARIRDLLTEDGVALIHTIGRSGPPMSHSPWIQKYIFPGGYVPSLSEVLPPLERAGLWQTDIEVLRLHYALTIREWLKRFEANAAKIEAMHDARFVAMFRYYLTVCIVAFEDQMQCVYQLQLAKRRDAVPLTRSYLDANPNHAASTQEHVEAAE